MHDYLKWIDRPYDCNLLMTRLCLPACAIV